MPRPRCGGDQPAVLRYLASFIPNEKMPAFTHLRPAEVRYIYAGDRVDILANFRRLGCGLGSINAYDAVQMNAPRCLAFILHYNLCLGPKVNIL